jgi:hypothetical protein
MIEYVRLAVDVIGLCVLAVLFVWLNHGLYPVLNLRIKLQEKSPGLLWIRLEAENKSKVHAELRHDELRALLKLTELDGSQVKQLSASLSKKVAFDENSIPILSTTKCIEPSEIITIELLHPLSGTTFAVSCGFTVRPQTKKVL